MTKWPDISVLDLAPIREGDAAADAFRNSLDLARHVERLGYQRFWLAEHHNAVGIASAATAVVIAHVAAGTRHRHPADARIGVHSCMGRSHPTQTRSGALDLETICSARDRQYPIVMGLVAGRADQGEIR